jgi:CAAD domains of cyanobacterial aminoacyl-tRNA synthetase
LRPAGELTCLGWNAQTKSTKDTSEEIYERTEKIVADLKDKWDKTEEKPAALGLTAAAFVGLWVLNGVVNALDNIPVVSGILELVGVFVTSWFVYRYLVFGPGMCLCHGMLSSDCSASGQWQHGYGALTVSHGHSVLSVMHCSACAQPFASDSVVQQW